MARIGLGLGWYASSQTRLMDPAFNMLLPTFCSVQPILARFAIYCTAGVQPSAQRPIIVGIWLLLFARPFAISPPSATIAWKRFGLAAEMAHSGNEYDLSV